MLKNNTHKSVIIWLLTGCALIFLMVSNENKLTRLSEIISTIYHPIQFEDGNKNKKEKSVVIKKNE